MSDYYTEPADADLGPLFRTTDPATSKAAGVAAREAGEAAGAACLKKAKRTAAFDAAAAGAAMLELLADGVARSGEQLVDHCWSLGLVPHDARAFGPVFAALSRVGKIECVGFAARKKGHGTAGARMWKATAASA
jgi:hypothetical protein